MTWEGLTPPYRCIVVDPPWRFAAAATKADARRHYSTLAIEELQALPVAELADTSAHLWLWGVNGLMEEAHSLVRAWGFSPVTIVTWCKPGPGVGHYLRNNTEHVILATKGPPVTPVNKPLSTWYLWQRGRHSEKPDAFMDLAEQVSPGPRVELFQRRCRFGWDGWGWGYEGQVSA
jgi:N6-adenosine-specific RNA methylase IME4